MTDAAPRLVFVYAADGGRWNALLDTVHKIVSPSTYACTLCALTHGAFGPHAAWTAAVAALPLPSTFLHRDELRAAHGPVDVALPAVLLARGETLTTLVSADELRACPDLDALIALVDARARAVAA